MARRSTSFGGRVNQVFLAAQNETNRLGLQLSD